MSCVDNEAAFAALTKNPAENRAALMPVQPFWSAAAHYDIAIRIERAPTRLNPADLPSRWQELPFAPEPNREFATLEDIFACCDLSRVLQRTQCKFPELFKAYFPSSLRMGRAGLKQATCDDCQLKEWAAPRSYDGRQRGMEEIGRLIESGPTRDQEGANADRDYARWHLRKIMALLGALALTDEQLLIASTRVAAERQVARGYDLSFLEADILKFLTCLFWRQGGPPCSISFLALAAAYSVVKSACSTVT